MVMLESGSHIDSSTWHSLTKGVYVLGHTKGSKWGGGRKYLFMHPSSSTIKDYYGDPQCDIWLLYSRSIWYEIHIGHSIDAGFWWVHIEIKEYEVLISGWKKAVLRVMLNDNLQQISTWQMEAIFIHDDVCTTSLRTPSSWRKDTIASSAHPTTIIICLSKR